MTGGFLVLKSGLPREVHDHIRDRCEEIFSTTDNPGNEILEMNPALRPVFAAPVVKGALSFILGDGHFLHPHRHCHRNRPDTPAQHNHKDSFSIHHHRFRWVMAMYSRMMSPPTWGPTGVTGEAGAMILVHHDVCHRALRNHSGCNRYMLKFLFGRAAEPVAPDWNHRGTAGVGKAHAGMKNSSKTQKKHRGYPVSTVTTIPLASCQTVAVRARNRPFTAPTHLLHSTLRLPCG